jgi:hypothetical protein
MNCTIYKWIQLELSLTRITRAADLKILHVVIEWTRTDFSGKSVDIEAMSFWRGHDETEFLNVTVVDSQYVYRTLGYYVLDTGSNLSSFPLCTSRKHNMEWHMLI